MKCQVADDIWHEFNVRPGDIVSHREVQALSTCIVVAVSEGGGLVWLLSTQGVSRCDFYQVKRLQ